MQSLCSLCDRQHFWMSPDRRVCHGKAILALRADILLCLYIWKGWLPWQLMNHVFFPWQNQHQLSEEHVAFLSNCSPYCRTGSCPNMGCMRRWQKMAYARAGLWCQAIIWNILNLMLHMMRLCTTCSIAPQRKNMRNLPHAQIMCTILLFCCHEWAINREKK